jgi:hypothetical protein
MAMKGMDPPSPVARAGVPNAAIDASSSDRSSQGDSAGAF